MNKTLAQIEHDEKINNQNQERRQRRARITELESQLGKREVDIALDKYLKGCGMSETENESIEEEFAGFEMA